MSVAPLSRWKLSVGTGAIAAAALTRHIRDGGAFTSSNYERIDWAHQSEQRIEERGSRGVWIHAALARVKQLIASWPELSADAAS